MYKQRYVPALTTRSFGSANFMEVLNTLESVTITRYKITDLQVVLLTTCRELPGAHCAITRRTRTTHHTRDETDDTVRTMTAHYRIWQ